MGGNGGVLVIICFAGFRFVFVKGEDASGVLRRRCFVILSPNRVR